MDLISIAPQVFTCKIEVILHDASLPLSLQGYPYLIMPYRFGNWLYLITVAAFLTLTLEILAQSAPPSPDSDSPSSESDNSLGAAARRSKAQKNARAKKIVNDDDLERTVGPLPSLKMDGAENSDEVIQAIAEYKQKHTPAQIEEAVRQWYDFYDDQLEAGIRDNIDIRTLRQANINNGYELCQEGRDCRKCETRRMAEWKGARHTTRWRSAAITSSSCACSTLWETSAAGCCRMA
jgi:hypothetical protein